ncbi:MAG: lytic transglycosylase domain-containing protein [Bacillota bacterium]
MRRKNKGKHKNKTLLRIILGLLVLAVLATAAFWGNELMLRSIYQKDHLTYVSDMAQEYGLDIYLVAAVVYVESEFHADAVSRKGAVGLMQIMPETGEWIAGKLGFKHYTDEMLKDPQTNLRFGCWYLQYLLERYDSDVRLSLCAYNAGPGSVDQWLNNPAYTDNGKSLAKIPFDETRQYVDKVFDANEQYEKLYPSGGAVGD